MKGLPAVPSRKLFPGLMTGHILNPEMTLLKLGQDPELDLVQEPAGVMAPAKGEVAVQEWAVEVVAAVEVVGVPDKKVACEIATPSGNYPVLP
jgi:hypothetical protein